ncbi:MAG: RNA polymerase sigma factor [Bacillus sp. (in: Bacteria)]|nr:RNA polymerase sigma factor [Bacillus sp. (in: firmicutes)]
MDLEEIYATIQPNIYAFFFVKTRNRELSEDLTQEVFYQAIKGFKNFHGDSSIKTWIFAIAKNVLKKHFRLKKYHLQLTEKLQGEGELATSLEEEIIHKEEHHQLLHLLEKLEPLPKEVATLRIYGELSFREIGALLDKSENYARITFHRAKLKMQKEMKNNER